MTSGPYIRDTLENAKERWAAEVPIGQAISRFRNALAAMPGAHQNAGRGQIYVPVIELEGQQANLHHAVREFAAALNGAQ